jgi:hypothetical protein
MKHYIEHLLLGLGIITFAACIASASCTPAERQAFDRGVLIGDTACVFAAKCAGLAGYSDLSDFCRIPVDAVKKAEAALGDAYCPVPDKDAWADK